METHRSFCPKKLGVTREEGTCRIEGYAAVFGGLSGDLGGFAEEIAPGAFDGVLQNDVRGLFNHNRDQVLGRTRAGTLTLSVDAVGLRYVIDMPAWATSIVEMIERGDVTGSSFSFIPATTNWVLRAGQDVRVIETVDALFDVGPVTFPAYEQTQVMVRSRSEMTRPATPHQRRRLRILEVSE